MVVDIWTSQAGLPTVTTPKCLCLHTVPLPRFWHTQLLNIYRFCFVMLDYIRAQWSKPPLSFRKAELGQLSVEGRVPIGFPQIRFSETILWHFHPSVQGKCDTDPPVTGPLAHRSSGTLTLDSVSKRSWGLKRLCIRPELVPGPGLRWLIWYSF